MSFYQRYELLDLLKDDGMKTFAARENACGRSVWVYLFAGEDRAAYQDLFEQLRSLKARNVRELIEIGEHEGTPFVVTEPLTGFATLRQWAAIETQRHTDSKASKDPEAFTRVGVWRVPPASARRTRGAPRA